MGKNSASKKKNNFKTRTKTNASNKKKMTQELKVEKFIIYDLLKEENIEEALKVIFSYDGTLNQDSIVELVNKRFNDYKSIINGDFPNTIEKYIDRMQRNSSARELFIARFTKILTEEIEAGQLIMLARSFWLLFPIAIKKCIKSPRVIYDKDKYLACINSTFGPELNRHQIDAHEECITSFNKNSDDYTFDSFPLLKVFFISHSIRPYKRARAKKKQIHRVLRRTKKIMITYKMIDSPFAQLFENKVYLVPDQFAKTIIAKYLTFNSYKNGFDSSAA